MGDYDFDITPLLWLVAFCVLCVWGLWELVDWLWITDVIKSSTIIQPEIELSIKNNVIDTVYIYKNK